MRPMSPVASQRPGRMARAVASGSRKYSSIRYGLRPKISPSWPSGSTSPRGPRISSYTVGCTRPAEVVRLAPPGAGLRLVEAPEVVEVGARIVAEVRRWGLTRRVVTEVVSLTEPGRLVEEQREGPFRRWVHTRTFAPAEGGCAVTEEIEYEPPGGMLGLTMTAEVIERELRAAYAGREGRVGR